MITFYLIREMKRSGTPNLLIKIRESAFPREFSYSDKRAAIDNLCATEHPTMRLSFANIRPYMLVGVPAQLITRKRQFRGLAEDILPRQIDRNQCGSLNCDGHCRTCEMIQNPGTPWYWLVAVAVITTWNAMWGGIWYPFHGHTIVK